MKALVLAPFAPESLDRLRKHMDVLYESWTQTERLWDPAELAIRLADETIEAVVIEVDFLFDEVFDDPSPLRFIGLCRNATNQVDMDAAAARGVVVANTPGRNANAVAEMTIGLAFALARRIPAAHTYVSSGSWEDPLTLYTELRGVELAGKTLGVVGLGAIGKKVARLGHALGMQVVGYDPFATTPKYVATASLEELLSNSNVVTLHAPETSETIGMIGAVQLALMPSTSYLINTASAALVDESALVAALKSKSIAGAALDVYETHPVVPNNPLLKLDNVVLTPHIGGATDETVQRYSQMITRDLLKFAKARR
jgi:D-3-phosphoglycerate dehydrogenase